MPSIMLSLFLSIPLLARAISCVASAPILELCQRMFLLEHR
jgi:hypothetical protein